MSLSAWMALIFFIKLSLFHVHCCFACMYICVKVLKPWNGYRQSWAAVWVMGNEPGSSGKVASALQCGVISPALMTLLFSPAPLHFFSCFLLALTFSGEEPTATQALVVSFCSALKTHLQWTMALGASLSCGLIRAQICASTSSWIIISWGW